MAFPRMSMFESLEPVNVSYLHGRRNVEEVTMGMHLRWELHAGLSRWTQSVWLGHREMPWKKGERFQVWKGLTIAAFKDAINQGMWTSYRGCEWPSADGQERNRDLSSTSQALNSANNLYEQPKGSFPRAPWKEHSPSNTFTADETHIRHLTCKTLSHYICGNLLEQR